MIGGQSPGIAGQFFGARPHTSLRFRIAQESSRNYERAVAQTPSLMTMPGLAFSDSREFLRTVEPRSSFGSTARGAALVRPTSISPTLRSSLPWLDGYEMPAVPAETLCR